MLKTLYLVEFTHKESQKSFHKFGITGKTVEWRFDPNNYPNDRYRYKEFDINEVYSITGPVTDIERCEILAQNTFPKNFNLETHLNKPYNYFSNGFTGITEAVILEDKQVLDAKTIMSKWSELINT